jgi:hypothetical protein
MFIDMNKKVVLMMIVGGLAWAEDKTTDVQAKLAEKDRVIEYYKNKVNALEDKVKAQGKLLQYMQQIAAADVINTDSRLQQIEANKPNENAKADNSTK